MYAECRIDEKRECMARIDTVSNFLADIFTHFHTKAQRARYADERTNPEWVDMGGES